MAAGLTRAIALLLCLAALAGCPEQPDAGVLDLTLAGERFTLELALTQPTRYQGLSDRPTIAPDGGMLFAFPRPQELCFVMRRCLTPIDLIFVGPSGRIVAVHEMQVEPYDTPEDQLRRYCSGWSAQFAIELRDGSIQRLKLEPGQLVSLPLEELKQRAR